MLDPIYLDHNATTPVAPEVLDAMLPWLRGEFGNPSSAHAYGIRARDAVERARAQVAAAIGARPLEIVFTSCGTESNNLAIFGLAKELAHAITSCVEHPSVAAPIAALEGAGWTVDRLGVGADGRVSIDELAERLTERTALVSVMLANNETGAIQPIAGLAELARRQGALMHTDAAQGFGKIAIDVDELGVDLLTLAGHKAYAPKGVGALFVRAGIQLSPVLLGGGQERGVRPGTENVPYIVGLGAAAELVTADLAAEARRQSHLRDALFEGLRTKVSGVARNVDGPCSPNTCLPNTLSVRFPDVLGSELLAAAPTIAASTGSACHEGVHTASAVLLAMGLPDEQARGTVRLSVGRGTTEAQVRDAVGALADAWTRLRG